MTDVDWWVRTLGRCIDEAEEAKREGSLDVLLFGSSESRYLVRRKSFSRAGRRHRKRPNLGRLSLGGRRECNGGEGGLPDPDAVLRSAGGLRADGEGNEGDKA